MAFMIPIAMAFVLPFMMAFAVTDYDMMEMEDLMEYD
jgi:hypothetical protein